MTQQRNLQMAAVCSLAYAVGAAFLYFSPLWYDPDYWWLPKACMAGFPLLAGWLLAVSKKGGNTGKPHA